MTITDNPNDPKTNLCLHCGHPTSQHKDFKNDPCKHVRMFQNNGEDPLVK